MQPRPILVDDGALSQALDARTAEEEADGRGRDDEAEPGLGKPWGPLC